MSGAEPSARAAIVAPLGPELSAEERALYRALPPLGFILFARNCVAPSQLCALVDGLRAIRPDAPVLIDQEGGRVCRLKAPHWQPLPPARAIGRLAEQDAAAGIEAARLHARLIAAELVPLGIDVDCAPVLDVPDGGAHEVIGDRAFCSEPERVMALGRAACEGFIEGGVLPVVKHMPGHGRARCDSHLELPVVDARPSELAAVDFVPFRALADMPFAMTAHIRYTALDPLRPATQSARVIEGAIRGRIGFRGVLISDDIGMGALSGDLAERTEAARSAGCDLVLHCDGLTAGAAEVLEAAGPLEDLSLERVRVALARRTRPLSFDAATGRARLAALLRSEA